MPEDLLIPDKSIKQIEKKELKWHKPATFGTC